MRTSPSNGRLAYLVIAHADPVHLGRLVRAVGADADVYVHLDAKVDDITQFRREAGPNARFVAPRHRVSWAGISMVHATLSLMRAAMTHMPADRPYSHLVLLSGACYPLRPAADIATRLQSAPETEFIRWIDMRASPDHYMRHVRSRWLKEPWYTGAWRLLVLLDRTARRIGNLLRLPNWWPMDVIPYFGSQWWALTPDAVRYVLQAVDTEPRWLAINRWTHSPDEHFFHTIIGNSPFSARSTGEFPYRRRGTYLASNLHLIHPSLSKWFDIADWPEVGASDALFVRKVGTMQSTALLDRIDSERLSV